MKKICLYFFVMMFLLLSCGQNKNDQQQQPAEKTADDFPRQIKIPKSSRDRNRPEKRRRKDAPPALRRGIHREWLGRQYKVFTCLHLIEFL